ncbi:MAG: methyltransferase domain-containing protein [Patescibacteria group bacterium]
MADSLFRKLTHQSLAALTIDGEILDVGGDTRSTYRGLIQGRHKFTTLNINSAAHPDINWDIEQSPWPVAERHFDAVLLINVLEHIFNYSSVLQESFRVTKPGGQMVIVVPFIYYFHPSPHDYFRYSEEALERLLKEIGYVNLKLERLGRGAVSTAYTLIHRFFPSPIHQLMEALALGLDWCLRRLATTCGKKYTGQEYPLGYLIIAQCPSKN